MFDLDVEFDFEVIEVTRAEKFSFALYSTVYLPINVMYSHMSVCRGD